MGKQDSTNTVKLLIRDHLFDKVQLTPDFKISVFFPKNKVVSQKDRADVFKLNRIDFRTNQPYISNKIEVD